MSELSRLPHIIRYSLYNKGFIVLNGKLTAGFRMENGLPQREKGLNHSPMRLTDWRGNQPCRLLVGSVTCT